ncbi:MAG: hypothetical protein IT424_05255 [Pirellulales bacterium]|nr:hypothetical protein [Pirellulales bacterium]
MGVLTDLAQLRASLPLAAALAAAALGCSGGSPYDLVPVAGTVTYDDGSLIPAESMILKFEPQAAALDPKTFPRKGFAKVDADGSFDLATTHKHGDGLVAGKHKVTIFTTTNQGKQTSLVPPEYLNPATTPIEIDTAEQLLTIKVQKPK